MTGLALEGGGVRGSYQAGVFMAMYEVGIKIDGVCGTSIGALNGAIIASGQGQDLPRIWRSLSMGSVFGFSESFVEASINKVKNINSLKLTILCLLQIIRNKGIGLEGLKKVIDDNLDVDLLLGSDIDYGMCTVRRNDLKPLYLFKEDMKPDKIRDYILASAFLPIFKSEKLIDDSYYLDGGFYDIGPVNMLLNKGYDTIYLVKVHGIGLSRPYDKEANVKIIESKRKLGGVLDLDPLRIEENIKMGYYDTIRLLKNYDGESYVFKNYKESYYKFLNRKVNNKFYRRVKNFLGTKTYKETTIKALEYIMEHENVNYYKIYKPYQMIKYIKKNYHKEMFIYKYINKLGFLV